MEQTYNHFSLLLLLQRVPFTIYYNQFRNETIDNYYKHLANVSVNLLQVIHLNNIDYHAHVHAIITLYLCYQQFFIFVVVKAVVTYMNFKCLD